MPDLGWPAAASETGHDQIGPRVVIQFDPPGTNSPVANWPDILPNRSIGGLPDRAVVVYLVQRAPGGDLLGIRVVVHLPPAVTGRVAGRPGILPDRAIAPQLVDPRYPRGHAAV